jgi:uncharacterized membrane protein (DUF106 family)
MPFGLGHVFVTLEALLFFGLIIVLIVAIIRAIVVAFRRQAATLAALEAIQRTLRELKSSVEAIERRQDRGS